MSQPRKPLAMIDLHSLSEDDRIALIAQQVKEVGGTSAVIVEDFSSKVERYKRKLRAAGLHVVATTKGPTAGAMTIKVRPQ